MRGKFLPLIPLAIILFFVWLLLKGLAMGTTIGYIIAIISMIVIAIFGYILYATIAFLIFAKDF